MVSNPGSVFAAAGSRLNLYRSEANQAPRAVLRATHEGVLVHCSLGDLKRFAVDLA